MSLYGTPRYTTNYRSSSVRKSVPQTGFWASYDSRNGRGQLTDPAAVRRFVAAGSATVTLESTKTETHFTYRIRARKNAPGVLFVSVLRDTEYAYLGYIKNEQYRHGHKSKIGSEAPSARAFEWFSRAMHQEALPAALRVWHEGRCGKCSRALTVPASVATGFGPECAAALGIEWTVPVCEAVAA